MENRNRNILIIAAIIIFLLIGFFVGRNSVEITDKKIEVVIPERKGSSPIIKNFEPIYIKGKDSIVYNDSIIYTENKFDKEIVKRFTSIDSNIDRIKMFISANEFRDYIVPFEDSLVSITNNIRVQGTLKSFQQDYTIKERKVDITIPEKKEKINIFLGAGISNTTKLDQFGVEANAGLQTKSGNILEVAYDTKQNISLRYKIKL